MSDAQNLPQRPDILLTIFHLVTDHGDVPLTQNEFVSVIRACGPFASCDVLLRHWMDAGYLRERDGRFCVLREHAKRLQQAGVKPALDHAARNSWVCDNATTGFW